MVEKRTQSTVVVLIVVYATALWALVYGLVQLMRYALSSEVTRWAYLSVGILLLLGYCIVALVWRVFRKRIVCLAEQSRCLAILNALNSFLLPAVAIVLVIMLALGLLS